MAAMATNVYGLALSRPSTTLLTAALLTTALSILTLAIYRLFLHPLAHIPGPSLAALTCLYEAYFDVYRGGKYQWEIQRLHKLYGPVVRIAPNAVHVNDISFADTLFTSAPQHIRDKDPVQASQFGVSPASFSTSGHALHRMRRAALSPLFSRGAVLKLQPLVNAKTLKLCERIETDFAGKGRKVPLSDAFTCCTTDIVFEYTWGQRSRYLDLDVFSPNMHEVTSLGLKMGHSMRHFPTATAAWLALQQLALRHVPR